MNDELDPKKKAQAKQTVDAMRRDHVPEEAIDAYLRQFYKVGIVDIAPPQFPGELNARNFGRAVVDGATFKFGDELGLYKREDADAFAKANPHAQFGAEVLGGSIAPIAAAAASPALATGAGAVGMGAAVGALNGVGAGTTPGSRVLGGVMGGTLGAAGGYILPKAANAVGDVTEGLLNRFQPARGMAAESAPFIGPHVAAEMDRVEKLAPGGASIATTVRKREERKQISRFTPEARGVGASPAAGRAAETQIDQQLAALHAAKRQLGDQMNALAIDVPVDADLHELAGMWHKLGASGGVDAPHIPNPRGFGPNDPQPTVGIQALRKVLSDLRAARDAESVKGVVNGRVLNDLKTTEKRLNDWISEHVSEYKALDRPYAELSTHERAARRLKETVSMSRDNYRANRGYDTATASLGASISGGPKGVVKKLTDKIFTNKAGAADATAQYLLKPGGAEILREFLSRAPQPGLLGSRAARAAGRGVATELPPALRGLLFPEDEE